MMRRTGAAFLALLRGLSVGAAGALGGWRRPFAAMSRLRLFWLGGAILLVAAGAGLWFYAVTGGKGGAGSGVVVALPPPGGKPSLLRPAPDPALVQASPDGPLPIIGKDGRQAWQVYARPFSAADKRPRVALIVTGLGLDRATSVAAMDRLPGAVTLAFNPYASGIKADVTEARSLGHEILIGLPMEPLDYPRQDPGPLTLLVSLDAAANNARLNELMGESTGYVGFVAIMGARFTGAKTALLPVLQTLKQRGLLLVDDRGPKDSATAPFAREIKLPWAGGDRVLDAEAAPAAVDRALADLESIAKAGGASLGIAALSPAVVARVAAWAPTLAAKGLALAPASAVANRQTVPPPAK